MPTVDYQKRFPKDREEKSGCFKDEAKDKKNPGEQKTAKQKKPPLQMALEKLFYTDPTYGLVCYQLPLSKLPSQLPCT